MYETVILFNTTLFGHLAYSMFSILTLQVKVFRMRTNLSAIKKTPPSKFFKCRVCQPLHITLLWLCQ